jgi:hypothetical protein
MLSALCGWIDSVAATAGATEPGSAAGANSTIQTPSRNSGRLPTAVRLVLGSRSSHGMSSVLTPNEWMGR